MTDSSSISKLTDTVGIFGLGIMGLAIAEHLTTHGWKVIGYDPVPLQQSKASAVGVTLKEQATDVVRDGGRHSTERHKSTRPQ